MTSKNSRKFYQDIPEKILYFFGSLIRNERSSKELSQMINDALDDPKVKLIILDECSVLLNNMMLWTQNYPYAYGDIIKNGIIPSYAYELNDLGLPSSQIIEHNLKLYKIFGNKLPNRRTVYRLHKKIEEEKLNQLKELKNLS